MNIESINSTGASQRLQETSGQAAARQATVKSTATGKIDAGITQPDNQKSETKQDISLENAVERLSKFVASTKAEINFSIDEESGIRVVKVLDSQSKDVIRQIPSEEVIQLAQVLDKLQGLFVKEKV